MKHVLISALILTFTASAWAAEEDHGSFGLLMTVTADGAQFGGLMLRPDWEINLTFDGSAWDSRSSKNANVSNDMGITGRVGYRHEVGKSANVSLGLHYHENFFGKNGDAGNTKERRFGPYIGFQRQFPGSPVYIMAFVLPVSYQTNTDDNNISGDPQVTVAQYRFFQEGGFGLAYMF